MPRNYHYRKFNQRRGRLCTQSAQRVPLLGVAQGFGRGGIFLVISFLLCGVLYLMTTNAAAVRGDEMSLLEREITTSEKEMTELRIAQAQLRSQQNIHAYIKKHNLYAITDPIHIASNSRVVLDR